MVKVLFFSEAMYLLSLISKHDVRRVILVMTDGSILTIMQHQQQMRILLKIEINESVFIVFFLYFNL